jgi:hypothetical protein
VGVLLTVLPVPVSQAVCRAEQGTSPASLQSDWCPSPDQLTEPVEQGCWGGGAGEVREDAFRSDKVRHSEQHTTCHTKAQSSQQARMHQHTASRSR